VVIGAQVEAVCLVGRGSLRGGLRRCAVRPAERSEVGVRRHERSGRWVGWQD